MGLATNAFRDQSLPLLQALPELLEGDIELDHAHAIFLNKAATFVDARSEHAYQTGHIPGALVHDRAPPRGLPVVTYCSGPRCPKAHRLAIELRRRGYQVKVMAAGVGAWKEADYPLKKGPQP